jgi:hypothetical protein
MNKGNSNITTKHTGSLLPETSQVQPRTKVIHSWNRKYCDGRKGGDFFPAINDTPIGTLFIEHMDCSLKQF